MTRDPRRRPGTRAATGRRGARNSAGIRLHITIEGRLTVFPVIEHGVEA